MTTYARPLGGGTPTTGQVVKAVHVNDPIDQIYDTILAGGITSDQIAAGAVDTAELATAAVTAVKMDGTLPDASEMATSIPPTLDKQLANKKYVDDQWTPTSYAGEESVTAGNGLITKRGLTSGITGDTKFDIVYEVAFPNGIVGMQVSVRADNFAHEDIMQISQKSADLLGTATITNSSSISAQAWWFVEGY